MIQIQLLAGSRQGKGVDFSKSKPKAVPQHEAQPLKASQSQSVSDHKPLIYPQGIFAFSCTNPPSAERMRWGYQVMRLDHQAQEKHLIELHSGL